MELFQAGKSADLIESLDIKESLGTFKWVVGNPPYVRNERLPEDYRVIYKEIFKDIAKGNTDLFTYFLRKGMDWLSDDGKMGIIVSLGIADSGASEKIRKYISDFHIEKIVSL